VKVVSIDSEYGFRGGDERESAFVPVIFCAVEVQTGERHAFWGRDRRLSSFIRDHAEDLFVSHSLLAEAKYLLRIGVTPPSRWWDSMLAWRYVTNSEVVQPFGLLAALVKLGLPYSHSEEEKGELQRRIGCLEFDVDSPDDRCRIRDYCFEDAAGAARLYAYLVNRVPSDWMRYAIEFSLELARMEPRGIGLDMARYTTLLERKGEVVDQVTAQVNAIYPVFARGQLSKRRFFSWCTTNGIGWPSSWSPRTGRKILSLDKKIFERMKVRHPFIAAVHEANKTAKALNDRNMIVDAGTGRHHFGNIPFAAATGRTSFKGFLFAAPKWMRWLAVPRSPEHRLVAVDFEAEEFLIAAQLSRDANMINSYRSGDPHLALAIAAGAAPAEATKATHGAVRKRYKAVNLGVNYGQTAFGIAASTGLHFDEARVLLAQHKRTFPDFWGWTDRYTTRAFREGVCYTAGAWPRKVSRRDNPRSVANFAVQGTGADLMRLATVYLSRQGLQLLATIHDGFLLECHHNQLPELREAVDFALRRATEQLLPGAPMRWTMDVYGDRFRDEEGEPLWQLVNQLLAKPTRKRVTVLVG
jgi:DNA polymerase I-like protein with 3'-5' exonuclease and polymerase domains